MPQRQIGKCAGSGKAAEDAESSGCLVRGTDQRTEHRSAPAGGRMIGTEWRSPGGHLAGPGAPITPAGIWDARCRVRTSDILCVRQALYR